MLITRSWIRRLVIIVSMSVVFAACGGSSVSAVAGQPVGDAAVDLIEADTMAQDLGIDKLTGAACDVPAEVEAGAIFICTADSAGQVVHFEATINGEDQVVASPTNVVDRASLGDYESGAVEMLNDAAGLALTSDVMDCGDRSVVLDAEQKMICAVTDPDTAQAFDAELTITDIETEAFTVKIIVGGQ